MQYRIGGAKSATTLRGCRRSVCRGALRHRSDCRMLPEQRRDVKCRSSSEATLGALLIKSPWIRSDVLDASVRDPWKSEGRFPS